MDRFRDDRHLSEESKKIEFRISIKIDRMDYISGLHFRRLKSDQCVD